MVPKLRRLFASCSIAGAERIRRYTPLPKHHLGTDPPPDPKRLVEILYLPDRNSGGEIKMIVDEMYEGLFRSHHQFRNVPLLARRNRQCSSEARQISN